MSLSASLNIGQSALNAASVSIEVLSHNVANSNTDGYSRQRLRQVSASPIGFGGSFMGRGVQLIGVERVADSLLGMRLTDQTGDSGHSNTLRDSLYLVETFFNETEFTGVPQRLEQFYDSLNEATADPSNDGLRNAVISAAQNMVDTIGYVNEGLTTAIDEFDTGISNLVDTVNELARDLANVNQAIVASNGNSGDLLDERDRLVNELAELVGATASIESDGRATVIVGGQALVTKGTARTLSSGVDATTGNTTLLMSAGSGVIDITAAVGGKAEGLNEARTNTISYLADLDDFTATFANAFNAQHALGFDATGAAGGNVFNFNPADPSGSIEVDPALAADPNLLAFAGGAAAEPGDGDNLQLLVALEDGLILGGGTLSTQEFLANLTNTVATDVAAANSLSEQHGIVMSDLQSLRESISGVNADEEAITLVEVQTAYQSAARVIEAVDGLLQSLIAMAR